MTLPYAEIDQFQLLLRIPGEALGAAAPVRWLC